MISRILSILLPHPGIRSVIAEYLIRIGAQLAITSQLLRLDSKILFADLNFAFTLNAYIIILVASTFNSIINVELSKDNLTAGRFYGTTLKVKVAMHVALGLLLPTLLDLPLVWIVTLAVTGFISTLVEHQDVALRFHEIYSPFFPRCIVAIFFATLKCIAISHVAIEIFLICSLFEITTILLVNKKHVPIDHADGSVLQFLKDNRSLLLRSFCSNSLIFTFFRLDQFFVYTQMGRAEYAVYAFGSRINEALNGVTGILSRRQIPQILQNKAKYSQTLIELSTAHLVGAVALYCLSDIYIKTLAPSYKSSLSIFAILSASGIFLIFGQLRGTYFVSKGHIIADAVNAVIGIVILMGGLQLIEDPQAIQIAIFYGIAFFTSGVASSFLYRIGRRYFYLLAKGSI